jgi:DNA polymerase-3 subunit alpha
MKERQKNGPYKDIFDFVERIDGRVMNKRQMENLISAGVFDSLSPNRRQLMENLELLLRYGNEDKRPQGLFGLEVTRPKISQVEDWPPLEKLRYEFSAVGFYLTSHPLDAYGASLEQLGIISASDIHDHAQEKGETQTYRLAGIVITKQERAAKSGQRYAFVQLSDPTGVFEVTVFSELLSQYREMLEPGMALLITVSVQLTDDAIRLTCQGIESLEKAADGGSLTLTVHSEGQIYSLRNLLEKAAPGKTKIVLKMKVQEYVVTLALPSFYGLSPDLRRSLGELNLAA